MISAEEIKAFREKHELSLFDAKDILVLRFWRDTILNSRYDSLEERVDVLTDYIMKDIHAKLARYRMRDELER